MLHLLHHHRANALTCDTLCPKHRRALWRKKAAQTVNRQAANQYKRRNSFGQRLRSSEKENFNEIFFVHASCFNIRLSAHLNRCFVGIASVTEFSRVHVEI